ncbi:MAG TPA: sigma-54 dependent transcriptional regulator [Bryobacteraceae bacterium]|jgi:DNA-binding NtrC family response regulator|nr:sigma-54 dependent transcriptional regulator [Bryobacteraceae bacterium]
MKKRILVVEDEEKLRRVIELQLASAGFDVDKAAAAEEGLRVVDRADLVLTDLKLPNMDGLQFLSLIRRQNAQVPVVMMTAFGSVETAVEAMKAGATDFLLKPFSLDHMMQVVYKALEMRALRDENRKLKEELGRRYEFDNIIGRSGAMQEIFATIERVAPTRATVLLAGESGVGKDLIARAIHFHSPRRDRPLVKINCSSIPENLMESELFGYEKGAFTGANTTKPGKFEQADTGTVFLDEIGDVPGPIQVKLLRILQEREFERLGSNATRHIDVRVIAATNVDLRAALEQGTFREDLYYRLNVVPLNIPSLRERKQDIPFLANHFVGKLAPEIGVDVESITDAAMEKLMAYHWPGNVRELENVIERSLVMATGTQLDAGDIKLENAPRSRAHAAGANEPHFLPAGLTLDQYEQEIIKEALRRADGNKSQAARLLGLTRNALRYRLTQMGMEA